MQDTTAIDRIVFIRLNALEDRLAELEAIVKARPPCDPGFAPGRIPVSGPLCFDMPSGLPPAFGEHTGT